MSTDLRRSPLCATMDVHRQLAEENPEDYANNRRQIARLIATLQSQKLQGKEPSLPKHSL